MEISYANEREKKNNFEASKKGHMSIYDWATLLRRDEFLLMGKDLLTD